MKKPLNKRWKYAILVIALAQIGIIIGLLALPQPIGWFIRTKLERG